MPNNFTPATISSPSINPELTPTPVLQEVIVERSASTNQLASSPKLDGLSRRNNTFQARVCSLMPQFPIKDLLSGVGIRIAEYFGLSSQSGLTSQKFPIKDLPNELRIQIVEHADPHDAYNFALASQANFTLVKHAFPKIIKAAQRSRSDESKTPSPCFLASVYWKTLFTDEGAACRFFEAGYNKSDNLFLRQLHQAVISGKAKKCDIIKVAELLRKQEGTISIDDVKETGALTEEELNLLQKSGKFSGRKKQHLTKKGSILALVCEKTDLEAFLDVPDWDVASPYSLAIGLRQPPGDEADITLQNNILKSNLFFYPDDEGNTLLHRIIEWGAGIEQTKTLLEKGAKNSINWPNHEGETALHSATKKPGNVEIVKLLLENGATDSINQCDAEGQTPLHKAVESKDNNIIELLLANGAHQLKDNTDLIPLDWAMFEFLAQSTHNQSKPTIDDIVNHSIRIGNIAQTVDILKESSPHSLEEAEIKVKTYIGKITRAANE